MLYMPIIKSKRGEFTAVRLLGNDTKQHIAPFFDVLPPNRFAKKPKTLAEHLVWVAEHTARAWATQQPVWVDTFDVGPEIVSGNQVAIEYLIRAMLERKLRIVPVTGFQREAEHDEGILHLLAENSTGIAIRLEEEDLLLPTRLGALIDDRLKYFELDAANVDLIIDLRYLDDTPPTAAVAQLTRAIQNLPHLPSWRQTIFAASSMPNTLKGVCDRDASGYLARGEWAIWSALRDAPIKRVPTFGDYTTVPPLYSEMDTRMIAKHLGPNVKYTVENRWFVSRGQSFQEHGGAQYFDIASEIAGLEEFRGATRQLWG